MPKVVTCDRERCLGCLACVVACMDRHYDTGEEKPVSPRLYTKSLPEQKYLTENCRHCENAPCVKFCPTKALYQEEETALVLVDREKCVGCQACLRNCPYEVPRFDNQFRLVKCDGCYQRVKEGLAPVCVGACPTDALKCQ